MGTGSSVGKAANLRSQDGFAPWLPSTPEPHFLPDGWDWIPDALSVVLGSVLAMGCLSAMCPCARVCMWATLPLRFHQWPL